jgi:capsid protein
MLDALKRFASGWVGPYDGANASPRRRQVTVNIQHEDLAARQQTRRILMSNQQDLMRNFAIAKWAIEKHLDYVTAFTFQCRTPNKKFNDRVEAFIEGASGQLDFDVAGRHRLSRATRISEACRVVNGDHAWMKVVRPGPGPGNGSRGFVQMIESDLIRSLTTDPGPQVNWYNGVRVAPSGAAIEYALHRRSLGTVYEFDRMVPARNIYLHAWYHRFDQVRGISPISSALNWFRDIYEGFEYALAKLKVAQLFGLSIYRQGETAPGQMQFTEDANADGVPDSKPQVDFGKGPFLLDNDPGDRAEILESHTPSTETTDFLKLMVHVALRTLDIPYSFFDESFTNFYGSRGGLIQYLKGCRTKIDDNQEVLKWWARWQIGLAVADGTLLLPGGMQFSDIVFEWVPDGVPWWDPVKEVRGQAMAIACGLTSPQRVCKEIGTDFETNVDEISEAMAYAQTKNVDLVFADSTAFAPNLVSETEKGGGDT